MFDINKRFINCAVIIIDCQGNILEKNPEAILLLQQCLPNDEMAQTILQIDPTFNLKINSNCLRQMILIGGTPKIVNTFKINHEKYGACFLLLFETAHGLGNMNFNSFMNYIDDAILITNRNHIVEEVNEAFERLTGLKCALTKGKRMEDLIQKNKYLKASVSLRVFELKKPQTAEIKYSTGKTLFWTAVPIFNNEGDVEWTVATGRDITILVDLEERLRKTERLKNQYRNRLKFIDCSLNKTGIIYSSAEMDAVIDIAMKASKSDSPVFIWGESGVGKELIADLVHRSSMRKKMPLIEINCAAIPSELLESELFVYAEGAFTGAHKGGKKGLFQEADGGTIFLDEIGQMQVIMQSKLLRVLQTNELMNIGSTKKIRINTRIISATNLSKDELENNSQFRQDLYYRLTVIPIYVPPLRERRDDIPTLIDHFLKFYNLKYETNKKFSGRLLRRLYHYDWPGNIRELKNVVERIIVFSDSDEIGEEDMHQLNLGKKDNLFSADDDIILKKIMPMKTAVQRTQEILLRKALEQYGSIAKAAKILNINPVTIHRIKKKMKSPKANPVV
jgi:PAS domain S-box-containing protein